MTAWSQVYKGMVKWGGDLEFPVKELSNSWIRKENFSNSRIPERWASRIPDKKILIHGSRKMFPEYFFTYPGPGIIWKSRIPEYFFQNSRIPVRNSACIEFGKGEDGDINVEKKVHEISHFEHFSRELTLPNEYLRKISPELTFAIKLRKIFRGLNFRENGQNSQN